MKNLNFLIIGQGLAGTLLSYELDKKNINHAIMNNPNLTNSSSIAAGIYNPVVFKRLNKSWLVDDLLPIMHKSYTELEKKLEIKLLYKKNIAKLIKPDEKDWWLKQIEKKNITPYFNGFHPISKYKNIKTIFESAEIKQSGHLDIKTLLSHYKAYFTTKYRYIECSANYDTITTKNSTISINNETFDLIIFCDGAQAINNPFLPKNIFYLSKGDIIEVEIEDLSKEYIINKDIFILPKENNRYIIGSTYKHLPFNPNPQTEDGEQLIEKASKLINSPIKLINHFTGVRPTVKDRRPFLGKHPNNPQMVFFNGLGTKGVMLAPYFAKQIVELILNNTSITTPEVRIERFF